MNYCDCDCKGCNAHHSDSGGDSAPAPEEKQSSAERLALEAEISRRYPWITQSPNPIPYQREGFRAGAQWKAAQVAEAVGKLEGARSSVELLSDTEGNGPKKVFASALAQLDAAIALLKGTK